MASGNVTRGCTRSNDQIHHHGYCFASVIVWTHIWPLCFILTVKQSAVLAACVFRTATKKGCQLFLRKKVHSQAFPGYAPDSGWPGLRIFWPQNDLAPLLRWRCQWIWPRKFCCFWSDPVVLTAADSAWSITDTESSFVHSWRLRCSADVMKYYQ